MIDGRRRFKGVLAGVEGDEVLLNIAERAPWAAITTGCRMPSLCADRRSDQYGDAPAEEGRGPIIDETKV